MLSKLEALVGCGALLGALCGCGSTTINPVGYNTSCSAAADCAAVFFGDVCGCSCENAAINKAELTRYQADFSAAHAGCSQATCQADCAAPSPCPF